MRSPRAFTLIEFLVVVSIICVLLVVLIPALLSAGEAARRISCVNNLKEISLALQNYHAVRGVLPAGCWSSSPPVDGTAGGDQPGWILSVLPKMEQSMLFHSFNFDLPTVDPANSTVVVTQMNTFTCPSAAGVNRGAVLGWPGPGGAPPSSKPRGPGRSYYAACHHDVEAAIGDDDHGVMYRNSRVRFADILDGLSSTILIGEIRAPSPLGWASGSRATLRNTGHPINAFDGEALRRALPDGQPLPSDLDVGGVEAAIAEGKLTPAHGFVGGFSSAHSGDGANFALADGSVHFLRRTIDRTIYEHMGNRSDGEPVDESAY